MGWALTSPGSLQSSSSSSGETTRLQRCRNDTCYTSNLHFRHPMASAAMPLSCACSTSRLIYLVNPSSGSPSLTPRTGLARRLPSCRAVSDGGTTDPVNQGVYGTWTVEPEDVREVILYRSGLVTAASSLVIASSATFLPESSLLREIIEKNLDLFYALGAGGLGLSLLLIHIYVTSIKRTLQALWVLGVAGSFATNAYLAQPSGENLVHYVLENPTAVWFVGPLFAALTGLVFKEGLCYGKLEAGILTFIIPTVLLGHLTGLMDDGVKTALLGIWMALFVIFAGRKFTQPIKDDIGDKSVFMFNALPEDEKQALIEKLELQKMSGKS